MEVSTNLVNDLLKRGAKYLNKLFVFQDCFIPQNFVSSLTNN